MNDYTLLGPWVRRFLLEYLVTERNLAYNTQCSYRDALILLIPFVADKRNKSVDRLTVLDLSADMVRLFLADLEQSRRYFHSNSQPALGCSSCLGPVCRRAQPRTYRLVWPDSFHPF